MSTNTIIATNRQLVSHHNIADVLLNPTTGQKSLHAAKNFMPGDEICIFQAGITQDHATYLTIQTGTDTHITLVPEFLQYTNHSCQPTVFFDTTAMALICLQPLQPGDELTFFYPSTEWEMAQPFVCNCGSANCLQLINGASHLSGETLAQYRLTDFIQAQARKNKLL